MPLLREIAENLSNNDLQRGVVEEIIDAEDLLELVPFQKTTGKAYVYNREKTASEGDFLDPNDTIREEASEVEEVTTKLRIIAGDVDVDKFLDSTMDDHNDQKAIQIAAKAKGMARKFKRALVQGDDTKDSKSFNGIQRLVKDTGHIINAGGNSLHLGMLDELSDMVANGADCLMMRRGTLRALKQLWRAAGGNTGGMLQINNFGLMVPAHDGLPIIINDFIPEVEVSGKQTASIYAMRLNEVDGVHGLYGGANAGVVVEDIGTVQNKDATRTRLKWYCGLALKSTQSLAALSNIPNV